MSTAGAIGPRTVTPSTAADRHTPRPTALRGAIHRMTYRRLALCLLTGLVTGVVSWGIVLGIPASASLTVGRVGTYPSPPATAARLALVTARANSPYTEDTEHSSSPEAGGSASLLAAQVQSASPSAGYGRLPEGAEATRPDGIIGRFVVGVLLAVVVALWIALVSIVVRVHLGLRSTSEGSQEASS